MRSFLGRKTSLMFLAAMSVVSVAAVTAYAVLPPRDVPPESVPHGTLATNSLDVLSVSAFTRAINQAHGTNTVLQHLVFTSGQSTLWHTHPGPNLVLVVSGELTLTHDDCQATTYTDGQGFATGLDEHLAVAGPDGADFYSLYFLPAGATDLRNPPSGQSLPPPKCATR